MQAVGGGERGGGGIFRSLLRQSSLGSSSRSFNTACHRELAQSVKLERVLAYENVSDISDDGFGFGGCASCLKYSDDGSRVAVAGPDYKVVVYDAFSGTFQYAIEGHSEIVTGLAWVNSGGRDGFHGDGASSFYTASLDKSIRLWREDRHVATYRDHHDWIRSLGISGDGRTLVSGCVSSNIFLWDTETGKTTCRTQSMFGLDDKVGGRKVGAAAGGPFSTSFEYSVNSVDFFATNPNVFVSGIRDGTVRMWDTRDISAGAVVTLGAHDVKLNQVQMGQGDSALLTSGRDSVIRLWDTRMLSSVPGKNKRSLLMEFQSHKCRSYNISCTFFSDDKAVATGSEDSKIWMYDTKTGDVIQTLDGHGSVVHFLAAPRGQSYNNLQLASSSIDNNEVNIWSAGYNVNQSRKGGAGALGECGEEEDMFFTRMDSLQSQAGGSSRRDSVDHHSMGMEGVGETNANASASAAAAQDMLPVSQSLCDEEDEEMEDIGAVVAGGSAASQNVSEMHRVAIESLMRKHGDLILRIFHACDYSFREVVDWRSIVTTMREQAQDSQRTPDFDPERLAEAVMEILNSGLM